MRVLFVLRRLGFARHFDGVVWGLAEAGHEVRLAPQDEDERLKDRVLEHPRITVEPAPRHRTDGWATHVTIVRRLRDCLHFLHPRFNDSPKLRARIFEKLGRAVSGDLAGGGQLLHEGLGALNEEARERLEAVLDALEAATPSDPGMEAYLRAERPDVVLVSPMVDIGSSQAELVKSARALGLPTAMLLYSWDNLSTKSLIHVAPDRVFVWNEIMRREAIELHRVPADRVEVTGAARFDPFFAMTPATSREAYCAALGLDPDRPIVLYLCSSRFVAPDERAFVRRWIHALKASGHRRLAAAQIVIRPHPVLKLGWHGEPTTVVRWPGADRAKAALSHPSDLDGAAVLTSQLRNADPVLFDCLFHSAGVVGLNTSAELEAAIVGRPVFTILDPTADGQQGTLHFHYLIDSHGGFVREARDLDEHVAQLGRAVAGEVDAAAIARFAESFLRPAGLATPVAPRLVAAIEQFGRAQPTLLD